MSIEKEINKTKHRIGFIKRMRNEGFFTSQEAVELEFLEKNQIKHKKKYPEYFV